MHSDEANLGFDCPRCGIGFPGEDDPEAGTLWVIGENEVVVCPECATPVDLMWQEIDRMGLG